MSQSPVAGVQEAGSLSRETILERLVRLIARRAGLDGAVETITEATGLLGEGVGLDSIDILALVAAIEQEFDLTIDDADLEADHFRTVGSLVSFVAGRTPR